MSGVRDITRRLFAAKAASNHEYPAFRVLVPLYAGDRSSAP
jgi:hypothetical protein